MNISIRFAAILGAWGACTILTLRGDPVGGVVASGAATFNKAGNTLTVNQATPRLIVNWNEFSIGGGEVVRFVQPGAAAAALNRVVSGVPSSIYGRLEANGTVLLINPNGILVGPGGVINTRNFVGSTLDVSDADFLRSGDLTLWGASAARIENQGRIEALGGDVYLIARHVENAGEIRAAEGTVGLAGGTEVTLHSKGSERIGVLPKPGPDAASGSVANSGLIAATAAELKAAGNNMYALAINNAGVVRANTVANQGGRIVLRASGGTVQNRGSLDAAGTAPGAHGGEVRLTGERVHLAGGSRIEVRGDAGGGTALIGGDYRGLNPDLPNARFTTVDAGARIEADGVSHGDGGKVVVWSDDTTVFNGTITARAGAQGGGGGSAEVSGRRRLGFDGTVDLSAAAGSAGTLLLDPDLLTVGVASTDDAQLDDGSVLAGDGAGTTFRISAAKVVASLNTQNTRLEAATAIEVASAVDASLNANAHDLTLRAPRILLGADVATRGAQTYDGAVSLGADVALRGAQIDFRQGIDAAAPVLSIAPDAGNLRVSWSGAYHGFQLFGSADFAQWTALGPVDNNPTVIPPGLGPFFRLAGVAGQRADWQLDLQSTAGVTFGGRVGGQLPFRSLRVNGPVLFGAVGTTIAPSVQTAGGGQTFDGPVTLGGDTVVGDVGAGNVVFNGTLDSAAAQRNTLAVNTAGNTVLGGNIGGAANGHLGALTTDAAGTTTLGQVGLLTIRAQSDGVPASARTGVLTFRDPVLVLADVAVASQGVNFGQTLDSAAAARALAINVIEAVTFGGPVGRNRPLAELGLRASRLAFDSPDNDVLTLAAELTGLGQSVAFTDVNDLVVGSAGGVNGLATAGGDVALATGGRLTLGDGSATAQPVIAPGATVALRTAAGGVTENANSSVAADRLLLAGTGAFTLDQPGNDVATLAAAVTGPLTYRDANALAVGTAAGVHGLASGGGDVTLATGDRLTLGDGSATAQPLNAPGATVALRTTAGGVTENANSSVVADRLLLAGTGAFTFDQPGNDVATLAAAVVGPVTFRDANMLAVGTAGGVHGLASGGGDVTLATSDRLTLGDGSASAQPLNAPGATVALRAAAGGVTENANSSVVADRLLLAGTGAFTLDQPGNDIATLAAAVTGSLTYRDATALTVASLGTVNGVASGNNPIRLATVAGGLTVEHTAPTSDVNAGSSTVQLSAGGDNSRLVLKSGAGVAGDAGLELAADRMELLGPATTKGTAWLHPNTDARPIRVGGPETDRPTSAGGTLGLAVDQLAQVNAGPAGTLRIGSPQAGELRVQGALAIGAFQASTLVLESSRALAQDPAAPMSVRNLALRAGTSVDLPEANQIQTLAAQSRGAFRFNSASAFTVGSADGLAGIDTHGGDLTLGASALLTLGDGSATAQPLNALGATLTLRTTVGGVTENANSAVVADRLLLAGAGTFTLDQPGNNVATLAAALTGPLTYRDANTLAIGTAGGVHGLASGGGDVALATGDRLTLGDASATAQPLSAPGATVALRTTAGGVTENANSAVAADRLLLAGAGAFTLDQPGNDVATLAAALTGPLTYRDANTLAVGTAGGVHGLASGGADVTLATGDRLTLGDGSATAQPLNAPGATVTLRTAAGGVIENANSLVAADRLLLAGTGAFALDQPGNDLATLAAALTGPLIYRDANRLAVGTAGGVQGLASGGGDVTLATGDRLTLGDGSATAQPLNAPGATVTLRTAAGGVTENANSSVVADRLLLAGTGAFTLDQPGNDLATLAAAVTGPLTYRDANTLAVGSAGGIHGLASGGGAVTLATGDRLTLGDGIATAQPLNAPGATVTLRTAAGGVTENANSSVVADRLLLAGTGAFMLDQPANDVATFAAALTGPLTYRDANTLAVGSAGGVQGLASGGGDVTLATGDRLILGDGSATAQPLVAPGATVTLRTAAGGVTENANGSVAADRLLLAGVGAFTLDQPGNDVATLAAALTGPLTYRDANALAVGTAGGVHGLASGGADVTLATGDRLALGDGSATAQPLNAPGATVTLRTAAGGVTENANSSVAADRLLLAGTGTFTLDQPGNDLATLAAAVTGPLTYRDANTLAVGSAGGIHGLASGGGDVTLATGDRLTLGDGTATAQPLNAPGATVTLRTTAGGVAENANSSVVADRLLLAGAGLFQLDQPGNDVAVLAADLTGPLTYRDANALEVGSAGGTAGLDSHGNDITLRSSGPMTLGSGLPGEDIRATGATLRIDLTPGAAANAGVTEDPASQIAAGNLILKSDGAGDFLIESANNAVNALAAAIHGRLRYRDLDQLTVGTVQGLTGASTDGHDLTLTTGDRLTLGTGAPGDGLRAPGATVALKTDRNGILAAPGAGIIADTLRLEGRGDVGTAGERLATAVRTADFTKAAGDSWVRQTGPLALQGSTGGALDILTDSTLRQGAAPLAVTGPLTLTAPDQDVILDNPANDLARIDVVTARNATLADRNGLDILGLHLDRDAGTARLSAGHAVPGEGIIRELFAPGQNVITAARLEVPDAGSVLLGDAQAGHADPALQPDNHLRQLGAVNVAGPFYLFDSDAVPRPLNQSRPGSGSVGLRITGPVVQTSLEPTILRTVGDLEIANGGAVRGRGGVVVLSAENFPAIGAVLANASFHNDDLGSVPAVVSPGGTLPLGNAFIFSTAPEYNEPPANPAASRVIFQFGQNPRNMTFYLGQFNTRFLEFANFGPGTALPVYNAIFAVANPFANAEGAKLVFDVIRLPEPTALEFAAAYATNAPLPATAIWTSSYEVYAKEKAQKAGNSKPPPSGPRRTVSQPPDSADGLTLTRLPARALARNDH
jgi:filamentous hemagglutinin family protein